MTGLVRKATLLSVCGLLAAATAMADVPSPGNSSLPSPAFINTEGTKAAPGNPAVDSQTGAFTITVRNFSNVPISGSRVAINFQNCSDTRICTAVVAGQTVDCVNDEVSGTTNGLGQITFNILGAATNQGLAVPPAIFAGAGLNCARVYADGVQLGTLTVANPDENGATAGGNGVNGADIGVIKNDVGANNLNNCGGPCYRGRADIDHNGSVNGADIAAMKDIVGRSALGNGGATGCADGTGPKAYCI